MSTEHFDVLELGGKGWLDKGALRISCGEEIGEEIVMENIAE